MTVAFLAVTLIPLALIAYVNDLNSRQALTVEANDKLGGAAQQTAALLDEFMIQNTNSVRTDAQFAAVVDYVSIPLSSQRENSPQEIRLQRFLASAARRDPVYLSSIAIIDAKGKTLVDTDSTQIGSDRSNRVYFQEVLKTCAARHNQILFVCIKEVNLSVVVTKGIIYLIHYLGYQFSLIQNSGKAAADF